jgi:DNA-binding transcriptional MerR regulator
MPERANVTSVDALKTFRSHLIVYVSKARPTLEEVTGDIMRTRLWLESDRRVYWEAQVRRRTKELERAQQAMFGVGLSKLREVSMSEKMAVRKAKLALEEAETKLKRVKQWIRELGQRLEPLTRQLEKLHTILSDDMVNAMAYLAQAADTLDAYAEATPSPAASNPAPLAAPKDGAEPAQDHPGKAN